MHNTNRQSRPSSACSWKQSNLPLLKHYGKHKETHLDATASTKCENIADVYHYYWLER